MNWQYATADLTVANRINEQGYQESCLVSALRDDAIIEPYVAPPPPVQPSEAELKAQAMGKLADLLGLGEAQLVELLKTAAR